MQDYFTAKLIHLEDTTLLTATHNAQPILATLGIDNLLNTVNIITQTEKSYTISSDINPTAFTISPDHLHCLLGNH